jgi:hypothetical protein
MALTSTPWRKRVRNLMAGNVSLSKDERTEMMNLLLSASTVDDAERTPPAEFSPKPSYLSLCLDRVHKTGMGYLLSAALTAAALLLLVRTPERDTTPTELTSLPHAIKVPRDFTVPAMNQGTNSGRFFSWRGKHAVRLVGNGTAENWGVEGPRDGHPLDGSLIMVSLGNDNDPLFTPEKQTTRYQIPGEEPVLLTTWSENGMGYALFSRP